MMDDELTIPESELRFTASRSGGPGGQNVNKVSSRVTVELDLEASLSLTDDQKTRIRARLASRINNAGVLRVTSQKHRSQSVNRQEATERLNALIRDTLVEQTPRRETKVTKAAKAKRLEEKRRRANLKRLRTGPDEG